MGQIGVKVLQAIGTLIITAVVVALVLILLGAAPSLEELPIWVAVLVAIAVVHSFLEQRGFIAAKEESESEQRSHPVIVILENVRFGAIAGGVIGLFAGELLGGSPASGLAIGLILGFVFSIAWTIWELT